jgi:ribosomal protein L7/L12
MLETAKLKAQLQTAPTTLVLTGFQSVPVVESEALRHRLRGSATVVVAKNTQIRIAANQAGVDLGDLTGPTALVLVVDLPEVLRDLLSFTRTHPGVTLLFGYGSGGRFTADELWAMAAPPLEAEELEEADEAQATFDVVLTSAGSKKIAVIKTLRELTNLGLKEAKDAAESVPFVVLEGATEDKAKDMAERLKAAGAEVELR